MQTFLPYSDFKASAQTLDRQRLGKQRVECKQILQAIYSKTAWSNHPAVRMWRRYEVALYAYYQAIAAEWVARGYKHSMQIDDSVLRRLNGPMNTPPWLGDHEFHLSHKSNLIRKMPTYYAKIWPSVPNNLPYVWPVNKRGETIYAKFDELTMTELYF